MEKIYVGYDCLKCFIHQIDKILNLHNLKEDSKKKYFLEAINFLSNIENFNVHPPEIARLLYNFLYKLLGNNDPFKKIKDYTNNISNEVINTLESRFSNISLEEYLKYSVAGNVIDFGVSDNKAEYNIEELIELLDNFSLDYNDFDLFVSDLKKSKKLLFILDNSGEAIFDLALIKKIKEQFLNLEIVVVAREQNIINDVSFSDALNLGFTKYAKVISSGYGGPGICLEKCSKDFINEYNLSEIVFSKGQGNFETLWGENKNIYFALKIKCKHVALKSGFPLYSNIFIKFKNYLT